MVGNEKNSIHEKNFPIIPKVWENPKLNEKWINLFKIKQAANIAIEEKRAKKIIGSSLEADLTISIDEKNFNFLEGLDLAEYFITSKAVKQKTDKKGDLKIEVKKAEGSKCPRCWKILETKCDRCQKVNI